MRARKYLVFKLLMSQAVVVHTFNCSTWEAEAGKSLRSRPNLVYSEFQESQGYIGKSFLKKLKQIYKQKPQTKTGKENEGELLECLFPTLDLPFFFFPISQNF